MWPKQIVIAGVGVLAVSAWWPAMRAQSAGETLRVSVVATDSNGQSIRGLQQSDFFLKDDGRDVAVTSFQAVTSAQSSVLGRSIVLMLGSSGMRPELTARVQRVGQRFFDLAGDDDEISVVRFAVRQDEVAGSRSDMLMRLAEYRASYGPPLNAKTSWDVLEAVAKVSEGLAEAGDERRKAIVWVGPAWVVDVTEPKLAEHELIWERWVNALTATARANVSVYAIDAEGLTGRVRVNPYGLIAHTGGMALENTNEWENAVARVWQETGSYYTLEYIPARSMKSLHSVQVKSGKSGVKVRARRTRGEP
jgi:hypothetical protein